MKKWLLLALLAFGAYKFHQNGYSFSKPAGAFDRAGKSQVIVFTGHGCGEHCARVLALMNERNVAFQEISVTEPGGEPVANSYGINQYPMTLIGKQQILGDDLPRLSSALAEAYGKDVLPRMEGLALSHHFDEQGRAKVVMYATSWCPYCKQQRAFFAERGIAYEEVDVEASDAGRLAYGALKGTGYPLTYVGYRRFSGYQDQPLVDAVKDVSGKKFAGVR